VLDRDPEVTDLSTLLTTEKVVDGRQSYPPAVLRLAFRPFFLLGALFSMISLALWGAAIGGVMDPVVYGGPQWWHMHEMLFGFVSAIVVGFLLTAVRTWTGKPGLQGIYLACLVLLWFVGRVTLFFPILLPTWTTAVVDLVFLPMAALILAIPIVRVKQWRNIVFVPLLLVMTVANAAMHWAAYTGDGMLQLQASTAMVMLVTLLMSVMAGRVLPMFTANGTGTERVVAIGWLEKLALISMLLAVAASLVPSGEYPGVMASCFILAALVHGTRAFRWRIWVTFRTPLVWSLHLSYWCIPLGLLLYGLSRVVPGITHSQATHTLTVGAMGMMILAMISRVSLGHTGRPLRVAKIMVGAFVALFSAFVVRVFGVYWFDDYTNLISTATLLWVVAYGCFVVLYMPILIRPRIDGQPG